jgi:hypothetical protein
MDELEQLLEERGLAMTIWFGRTMAEARFTVWLFAADDPEIGIFAGSADKLEDAIDAARQQWDHEVEFVTKDAAKAAAEKDEAN